MCWHVALFNPLSSANGILVRELKNRWGILEIFFLIYPTWKMKYALKMPIYIPLSSSSNSYPAIFFLKATGLKFSFKGTRLQPVCLIEQVRHGGRRPVKERHICPTLLLRFSSSGSDPVLSANMTLMYFPAFPPLWLVSICSHSARRWRWRWAGKVEKANSWWPFVKSLLHVFSYREQKCRRFNNKSRLTAEVFFFCFPSRGSCENKHPTGSPIRGPRLQT